MAKTFQLQRLDFGCVLTTWATAASRPTTCTVTVKGLLSGRQMARQASAFSVSLLALQGPLITAALYNDFGQVDGVVFETSQAVPAPAAVAVLVDNAEYKRRF